MRCDAARREVGQMGGTERVVTAALVVVPGPAETVTFVRQQCGPYAGFWQPTGGNCSESAEDSTPQFGDE